MNASLLRSYARNAMDLSLGGGSDDFQADGIYRHICRWEEAREFREPLSREIFRDRQIMRGDHFNAAEKQMFRDMDWDPPNYQLVLPLIQTVCGMEAQNRSDLKVLPQGQGDIDGASAATHLMRKVAQSNQMDRQVSAMFRDAAALGLGWVECAYNPDPMADPLLIRHEALENVWTDPASRDMDLEDAEDLFRSKLLRPLQLARLFPAFRDEIMSLRGVDGSVLGYDHTADYTNRTGDYPDVQDFDQWSGSPRVRRLSGRTRLLQPVERWYRIDETVDFVRWLDGRCLEIPWGDDEKSVRTRRKMAEAIYDGEAYELQGSIRRIRYAIFCEDLLLGDFPSPYRTRRFPLVPCWGYQDEYGLPMGLVRQIRTPAKDFNARMYNMLKRSLTRQVWAEDNVFADNNKAREELAMADGLVLFKQGKLDKAKLVQDIEPTAIEQGLLQMDLKIITDLSGVTQELSGHKSNADSGIAIKQKIEQGQTGLYSLFDNRNFALHRLGQLILAGIQEKYTDQMAVRVTESTKGIEWVTINQKDPTTGTVLNDMGADYDLVISDVPASANDRMAKFEALVTFLAPMPVEVKMIFAAKLASLADIPDAMEVAQQLDDFRNQMTGMTQQQAAQGQPGAQPAPQTAPIGAVSPDGQPPAADGQPADPDVGVAQVISMMQKLGVSPDQLGAALAALAQPQPPQQAA